MNFDMIPPGDLWKPQVRQAMEDEFAEKAREILRSLGVNPGDVSESYKQARTNDFGDMTTEDDARRAEVASVASRLAERLKEQDQLNNSIGGGT